MKTKTIRANGSELLVPETYQLQQNEQQGPFDEIGSTGIEAYAGWIHQAYHTDLFWPGVAPLYSRIWRSDPETTTVRHLFSAWAGKLSPEWVVPERKAPDGNLLPATDDDKRAAYFANTAMEDIKGGIDAWLTSALTRVPFFGWGFWEAVPGLRQEGWTPPGEEAWESKYDDGLVGLRKLGFRDYSSFFAWDMDDHTGRVRGMEQHDPPNPKITIPVDRALHIRYGDLDNPEGLATLEAIWRLQRIKEGLEVVQGIGFEHTAGHVRMTVEGKLDAAAKAHLKRAARAIATAQEGNYITQLRRASDGSMKFEADVMDIGFEAAPALLEAIRYYGILKLALFGMQFVAISSLSGVGSRAAMSDASEMAILMFNNTANGVIQQAGEQLGDLLFDNQRNRAAFPDMTRRPELTVNEIEKPLPLNELGAFVQAIDAILPLGEDDAVAIRSKSQGVLAETPPEDGEELDAGRPEPFAPEDEVEDDMPDADGLPDEDAPESAPNGQAADMAQRVVGRFSEWAAENEPDVAELLEMDITEDGDGNEAE